MKKYVIYKIDKKENPQPETTSWFIENFLKKYPELRDPEKAFKEGKLIKENGKFYVLRDEPESSPSTLERKVEKKC